MNNKLILVLLILLPAFAFLLFYFLKPDRNVQASALDLFAQCLKDKGAVMYGADWCPHCQNEKKAFGDSFRYINYVECPKDPKRCLNAGVAGYPTWIFPDGKNLEGEQGLRKLKEVSGCILPEDIE